MEDKEAEKASQMRRIFVGGLGESVTAEDLQRLFGSLGVVQGLDIVRSKSRSFAYIDFSPSSLKSLSKLFSTYNGCVWKGGRLKLEKAREHYLVRLKREWAEQAELASREPNNGFDVNEDIASSNKPKKDLNSETKQLRIYFPSLRKVKVLPLSGSGKHKYSFRNVEVPPLPIHFCDCEEHSIDPHPAKEKQANDLEAQSGGMNEEEINIMNSVMNKLFEREKVSDAAHSGNGQAKERDNSAKLISGLQFDENEADSEMDEDNLIINVVKRKNNRMDLLGVQEKEQISENQDFSGKRTSKDRQNQNALKEQKRNTVPPNKKRKSLNQESDENGSLSSITRGKGNLKTHSDESAVLGAQLAEPESRIQQSAPVVSWSQKSSWRALVGDQSNTSFSVSHILPGIASSKEQQPKFDGSSVPDSTPAKPRAASSNSGRGAAWLQKSSWTQLISENNNSSFSLEQLLPGISYEKQVQAKPNSVDIVDSTNTEHSDLRKDDNSELPGNGSTILVTGKDVRSTPERHQQTVVGNNEAPSPIFKRKHDSAPKLTSNRTIIIGETCSFMRSAASLKEWSKAKAASGSLKRKSGEK
nr:nucleolar protein 8 [Quercus suber]